MAEKKPPDEKADRRAKALRDNLKRRKAAQRKAPATGDSAGKGPSK